MHVEVISRYEDFLRLQPEWDRLLAETGNDNLCLTFEWLRAWWEGFGRDKELFVHIVRNEEGIIGAAPLMITSGVYRRLKVREIRFMENEHTPSADFIIKAEHERVVDAVFGSIRKQVTGPRTIVRLNNIPKDSPTMTALGSVLKKNGMLFGTQDGLRSPYIKINVSWNEYLEMRSRKFRKTLRNKINRISKEGTFEIRKYESGNDWESMLETIYDISEKSWKAKHNKDVASVEENKIYFRELTRTADRNKWLAVWVLNIGDKPAAYEYHLRYGGVLYALRSDFNEDYKESSPGSILDRYIVEDAFNARCAEYNMCGSSDYYKLNWTRDIKEHKRVIVYNTSVGGRLLHFMEFTLMSRMKRYRIARALKRHFFKGE